MQMRKMKARPIKKPKRAPNKTQTKIRTAMYLSRRRSTKKLTPLNTRKTGSNTSKEVPKRPKNTWNNRRFHAGFKQTED